MTNSEIFSWEKLSSAPMIGIIRGMSIDDIIMICSCFERAELTTLEVTMNTPDVLSIISELRTRFPNLNIGAGTVCNAKQLDEALHAGAQFIVTPITDEMVIKRCVSRNIPIFPGALTPTEIYKAWELGSSAIKIFPASTLGPGYIKDIQGPMDQIKLIPTGGVSSKNIRSYFDAGAFAVGMGSGLLNKASIETRDHEGLIAHFLSLKEMIKDYII